MGGFAKTCPFFMGMFAIFVASTTVVIASDDSSAKQSIQGRFF
jgi:hypothetical protein